MFIFICIFLFEPCAQMVSECDDSVTLGRAGSAGVSGPLIQFSYLTKTRKPTTNTTNTLTVQTTDIPMCMNTAKYMMTSPICRLSLIKNKKVTLNRPDELLLQVVIVLMLFCQPSRSSTMILTLLVCGFGPDWSLTKGPTEAG